MYNALMGFAEAGPYLGFTGKSSGKTTLHKLCAAGRLTKVRLGGRSFITRESAESLIRQSIDEGAIGNPGKGAK